jgi:hypothetical protein
MKLRTECTAPSAESGRRGATGALGDATLPVVGPSFLDGLREELDEYEGCRRVFADDFIEGLPRRFNQLRLALTTGDLEGSLDAVQGLKLSSHAVGAERLSALLTDLEGEIRIQTREADAVVLPRLAALFLRAIHQCGLQTKQRLEARPFGR